mmetsp:Transcript_24281/g.73397  ORF Transcript_24281/g.73397 Transcript_24281/m.73397 type:complete len:227 (+) Transcript_24281:343-1023(+)
MGALLSTSVSVRSPNFPQTKLQRQTSTGPEHCAWVGPHDVELVPDQHKCPLPMLLPHPLAIACESIKLCANETAEDREHLIWTEEAIQVCLDDLQQVLKVLHVLVQIRAPAPSDACDTLKPTLDLLPSHSKVDAGECTQGVRTGVSWAPFANFRSSRPRGRVLCGGPICRLRAALALGLLSPRPADATGPGPQALDVARLQQAAWWPRPGLGKSAACLPRHVRQRA